MTVSGHDQEAADVLAGYDKTFEEEGHIAAVDKWFADDGFYWLPGDHAVSGFHRGPEGVKAFYDTFTTFDVSSDSLVEMAAAGWVANVRTLVGKRPDGRDLDTIIVGIYQVRDGKITSGRLVPTEPDVMDGFFR